MKVTKKEAGKRVVCNSQGYPLSVMDGELYWYPDFIDPVSASALYRQLEKEVIWRQDYLRMGARQVAIPRLQAWYGEQGYRYSGLYLEPQPWLAAHRQLLALLEEQLGLSFNSVLMNLYRDGNDSVGWHADDEPELGINPCIASLSLGATRRFHLRHREHTEQRLSLELGHGALLVMSGPMQHHWRHQIPKTRRPVGPRINLTFRSINPPEG
ncbi:alpha-ketoglutarate-dependent dioxygenase AlkB family protein [Aestuariirhabdus litorea]|uniref:alpha-ketoglutarate-dependent dioxygenase AlkB family protein n=1 Tax=Aestuariirhabdus litorea TaxID=2528527 RepID=UPI001FB4C287|nr:alpha-ketoglutarate-dependent dioxygenase AlkB [Aestuariirhabdus litorea]